MHKRSVIMTDSNVFSLFPIIYSNSVNLGLPLADSIYAKVKEFVK